VKIIALKTRKKGFFRHNQPLKMSKRIAFDNPCFRLFRRLVKCIPDELLLSRARFRFHLTGQNYIKKLKVKILKNKYIYSMKRKNVIFNVLEPYFMWYNSLFSEKKFFYFFFITKRTIFVNSIKD